MEKANETATKKNNKVNWIVIAGGIGAILGIVAYTQSWLV